MRARRSSITCEQDHHELPGLVWQRTDAEVHLQVAFREEEAYLFCRDVPPSDKRPLPMVRTGAQPWEATAEAFKKKKRSEEELQGSREGAQEIM